MKNILFSLTVIILIIGLSILGSIAYTEFIKPWIQSKTTLGDVGDVKIGRTINLIGEGMGYNGDVVYYSTSTASRMFQFNSSTVTTWWDTTATAYPHHYGATPTAAFLVDDADLITLLFRHDAIDDVGMVLTCQFAVSNEDSCNTATVSWTPLPMVATSTWSTVVANTASSTMSVTPGAGQTEWAVTFTNVNYDCMQVKCYNGSTTADNLLWVEARLKAE